MENNLYRGKEKKMFFQNEKERNLWIRLNAERIRYSNKIMNHIDNDDLGSIDEERSPLWISNNQLIYDEHMHDSPRFSLEELSAMSHEDLFILAQKRNQEIMDKLFDEIFENNIDEL